MLRSSSPESVCSYQSEDDQKPNVLLQQEKFKIFQDWLDSESKFISNLNDQGPLFQCHLKLRDLLLSSQKPADYLEVFQELVVKNLDFLLDHLIEEEKQQRNQKKKPLEFPFWERLGQYQFVLKKLLAVSAAESKDAHIWQQCRLLIENCLTDLESRYRRFQSLIQLQESLSTKECFTTDGKKKKVTSFHLKLWKPDDSREFKQRFQAQRVQLNLKQSKPIIFSRVKKSADQSSGTLKIMEKQEMVHFFLLTDLILICTRDEQQQQMKLKHEPVPLRVVDLIQMEFSDSQKHRLIQMTVEREIYHFLFDLEIYQQFFQLFTQCRQQSLYEYYKHDEKPQKYLTRRKSFLEKAATDLSNVLLKRKTSLSSLFQKNNLDQQGIEVKSFYWLKEERSQNHWKRIGSSLFSFDEKEMKLKLEKKELRYELSLQPFDRLLYFMDSGFFNVTDSSIKLKKAFISDFLQSPEWLKLDEFFFNLPMKPEKETEESSYMAFRLKISKQKFNDFVDILKKIDVMFQKEKEIIFEQNRKEEQKMIDLADLQLTSDSLKDLTDSELKPEPKVIQQHKKVLYELNYLLSAQPSANNKQPTEDSEPEGDDYSLLESELSTSIEHEPLVTTPEPFRPQSPPLNATRDQIDSYLNHLIDQLPTIEDSFESTVIMNSEMKVSSSEKQLPLLPRYDSLEHTKDSWFIVKRWEDLKLEFLVLREQLRKSQNEVFLESISDKVEQICELF